MRIVLATFGSLGDIHPVIALGLELQRRGHHASIVTSEYHRERILATGLGFHFSAPDLRPDDKALIRATMDERRGPEEIVRFMLQHLPEMYSDYERAINADGGADLLVTSDLAYAGPILAEKTGINWASQVLSPLSFLSAYDESVLPPLPMLWRLKSLGPRAYGTILGLAKHAARRLSGPVSEFRRDLGLAPKRDPFFDDKHAPSLVLAMFSRLLGEPRPDWPRQAVVTGFAFYDGDAPVLSPDIRRFLAAGERPIVFTLGSAAVFDPGSFFIESARAAAALGRRALLIGDPDPRALPPAGLNIGVFGYAPFSELFPEAAAIVHQGGSGTTGQAMRAGRPMLIVPYAHDQPDNALRAKKLGISDTVARGAYRADRVARALERLLNDASVSARAQHIATIVAQEDGAASAVDAIERTFSGSGDFRLKTAAI
jgi:UDP:flavonoid glycosyltransferase YjiC (YdhE family)